MGACAANTVIILSRVTICARATSPLRKHTFSVQGATYGLVDSTSHQSAILFRRIRVDAQGDLQTGTDHRDKAVARDDSSPIRKHAFSVQGATRDSTVISDDSATWALTKPSSLARRLMLDTQGYLETGANIRHKRIARDKSSPIRKVATGGPNEISDGLLDVMPKLASRRTLRMGIDTKGNHGMVTKNRGKAVSRDNSSPIRKHAFSVPVVTDGKIKITDDSLDSTSQKSSNPASGMGVDAQGGDAGNKDTGIAVDKPSPIGKQEYPVQFAPRGNTEISDDLVDSTLIQSSTLAHLMGVDAKGDLDTADNRNKAIARDNSSPIRKHSFAVQVATNGNIEIPVDSVDSTSQQTTHRMGTDAKGIPEIGLTNADNAMTLNVSADRTNKTVTSIAIEAARHADGATQRMPALVRKTKLVGAMSLAAELLTSSKRQAVLRSIVHLLQKRVGHFRDSDHLLNASTFVILFGFVVGCLVVSAAASSILRDEVVRTINSVREVTISCGPAQQTPADSDGESGRSSDEAPQLLINIRTSLPSQLVARTGLLWKLERRFIDDLRSHKGPNFEPTDRFAYLESWDLRFFSLDVDEGAVLCTYVSQLSEFKSVVFRVRSIESEIITIPSLKTRTKRAKKSSTGGLIGFYDDYLSSLRQLGYDPPESGTSDPESLSVFIISGSRQGEDDGTRSVGRLKWHTGEGVDDQKDDKLSYMCLGSARCKDCKRWHAQIVDLLRRVKPKDVSRNRSSELADRLANAAANAALAQKMLAAHPSTVCRSLFAQDVQDARLALEPGC